MKVAIYARVSTDEQTNETQVQACKEWVEKLDHEIYDVYTDTISGATSSRPELNRLLQDMRHYHFRGIVVTKLDRIGRSLQHLLSLFDEFNKKSVEFIAVTQNIDTSTAAGKLQLQIMGAFAEFERNIISERTKEGMLTAVNVGKRGKDKKPRKKRGVLRKPNSYA